LNPPGSRLTGSGRPPGPLPTRRVVAAQVPWRAPRGIRTPTARSVAWCSASTWLAQDGSPLLTLGASSIQTDPDGSRRIVWMIKRMIKKIRRSTSRVMCVLGSGPRGWVQRFGSPACAVFAMETLFTSILKPAKQVDILLPRTYEPRGPAGLLDPRARQPSGSPQPRSSLGESRARNRASREMRHWGIVRCRDRRRAVGCSHRNGRSGRRPNRRWDRLDRFSCPSGQTLVLDVQQLAWRAQQALRLRLCATDSR
jgi:hypothetical protein